MLMLQVEALAVAVEFIPPTCQMAAQPSTSMKPPIKLSLQFCSQAQSRAITSWLLNMLTPVAGIDLIRPCGSALCELELNNSQTLRAVLQLISLHSDAQCLKT